MGARALRIAAGAGVALATAVGLAWFELASVDLGYHLAYGRWMLEQWTVLSHRHFSSVYPDYAFTNDKWLFQVVLAAIEPAGPLALVAGRVALVVGLGAVLGLWLARTLGVDHPAVWLGTVLALWTMHERLELRPELPGYAFAVAVAWQLERLRAGRPRALAALVGIELVWVNVHGSFPFGPLFAGLALTAALLPGRDRAPRARPFAVALALMLGATLANPYGWRIWEYPVLMLRDVATDPYLAAAITEFRPALHPYAIDTVAITLYRVLLVAVPVAALAAWARRRDLYPLLLLAVLLPLSLQMRRHVALFAPFGVWILCTSLHALLPPRAARVWRGACWLGLLGVAPLALLQVLTDRLSHAEHQLRRTGSGYSALAYPVETVAFMDREDLRVRFGNSPDLGSYLAWRLPGRPPIIDNHTNAVPTDFRREVFELVLGTRDVDAFSRTHDLVMWIVQCGSGADRGLLAQLARHPRWALVLVEPAACVFLARDAPEVAGVVARLAPAFAAVEAAQTPPVFPDPAPEPYWTVGRALSFATTAHRKDLVYRAQTLQQLGFPRQAAPLLARALEVAPWDARLFVQVADLLQELGDDRSARRHLEAALWLRPTHAVAHAQLGWLERRAGNLAAAEVHLRRACELEPHEPRHERALGEVLRERGGG